MKQKLLSKFNLNVSQVTISKYIDSFNYSFKRVSLEPERRNNSLNIEERARYAQEYLTLFGSIDEANMIFIDEIGFNVSMRALYGRSSVGKRAIHTVKNVRSKNISVCCAITKGGIIKYAHQSTAFNTISFENFVEDLMINLEERSIRNAAIIMDNVRFHKVASIRNSIERRGYRLLYLPPYSPFLNPIENAFSKWKQFVRQSRPSNEEELMHLISRVYDIITPNDCAGFYRNMMAYILKSIAKEVIND